MAALPKTETAILGLVKRHAAEAVARGEFFDQTIRGLSLVVGARSASWFGFFVDAGGKRRRVRLGAFAHPATGGERAPFMKLSDAREAFARLRGEARQSRDPFSIKKEALRSPTIAELCDLYLAGPASNKSSLRQIQTICRNDIIPALGDRRAMTLTRRDVHVVLDRVLARGALTMACRVHETMRSMFSWAIARELMSTNPTDGVGRPVELKARARVLSDGEIKTLWRTLNAWPEIGGLSESTADQVKLLMLLGCRERELGGLRWSEVDFDRRLIVLPADEPGRSKSRDEPFLLPLSAPAVAILKRAKLRAGQSRFVFPMKTEAGGDRPAAQSRTASAKRVINGQLVPSEGLFEVPWRLHDLRRTTRSKLSELRIAPHIAELVIGHSLRGIIAVYDRHDFLVEKREALDMWAEHLMRLVKQDSVTECALQVL